MNKLELNEEQKDDELYQIVLKLNFNDMNESWNTLNGEVSNDEESLGILICDIGNYIEKKLSFFDINIHNIAIQMYELCERLGHYENIESDVKLSKAIILSNWGKDIANAGRFEKNADYYSKSYEKYVEAVELMPSYYLGWVQWGNVLSDCGSMVNDEDLIIQSFDKYKKAIEINSDDDNAWKGWQMSLNDLKKIIGNNEKYLKYLNEYNRWKRARRNNIQYMPLFNNGVAS